MDWELKEQIIKDISEEMHHPDRVLSMAWEKGDVGFIDNRAVCHLASANSQLPPEIVGLRLL